MIPSVMAIECRCSGIGAGIQQDLDNRWIHCVCSCGQKRGFAQICSGIRVGASVDERLDDARIMPIGGSHVKGSDPSVRTHIRISTRG